jgi:hypothetical protein
MPLPRHDPAFPGHDDEGRSQLFGRLEEKEIPAGFILKPFGVARPVMPGRRT